MTHLQKAVYPGLPSFAQHATPVFCYQFLYSLERERDLHKNTDLSRLKKSQLIMHTVLSLCQIVRQNAWNHKILAAETCLSTALLFWWFRGIQLLQRWILADIPLPPGEHCTTAQMHLFEKTLICFFSFFFLSNCQSRMQAKISQCTGPNFNNGHKFLLHHRNNPCEKQPLSLQLCPPLHA